MLLLGIATFLVGSMGMVVQSRIGMKISDFPGEFTLRHESLVNAILIAILGICLVLMITGLVVTFIAIWWVALILFFIVMPAIIKYVST